MADLIQTTADHVRQRRPHFAAGPDHNDITVQIAECFQDAWSGATQFVFKFSNGLQRPYHVLEVRLNEGHEFGTGFCRAVFQTVRGPFEFCFRM